MTPELDILIPTADRAPALATTLAGLLGQAGPLRRILVADQSSAPVWESSGEVRTVVEALRRSGVPVALTHRPVRRGIAEQRQWLLDRASAHRVLCLDNDVLLAPDALQILWQAMDALTCGLVGMPAVGLSHLDDERPADWSTFEEWTGPVRPERIRKGQPAWERWRLHSAANPVHLERLVELGDRAWAAYKVAWINGCVLFDAAALRATGGYEFWQQLPGNLRGEDVVAQLRVIETYGGAGILPCRAYHLDLATSLPDREVDAYAEVLGEKGAA